MAQAYFEKASKKLKKGVDKKRRLREQVGDLVFFKMYNHARLNYWHQVLIRQYESSFSILKKVGVQAYKIELSPKIKYYPVFRVSLFRPYSWRPSESE